MQLAQSSFSHLFEFCLEYIILAKLAIKTYVVLNIGCFRMDILMLDMSRMKQTEMYICTLEEFILVVVVTLLYKWNEILNGIYIDLYTNI